MIKCKICNEKFKSVMALSTHLRKHKVTSKEYYDKYLKNGDGGVCLLCNKYTKYISMNQGYQKYCTSKCQFKSKFGKKLSKETRQKIRDSKLGKSNPMFGKSHSQETRKKISESRVGKKLTDEIKRKISESSLGKHLSKETRQKLSISASKQCGKNNSAYKHLMSYIVIFLQKNNLMLLNCNLKECDNIEKIRNIYKYSSYEHNWKCLRCNHIFKQRWNDIQQKRYKCPKCFQKNHGQSHGETDLGDWIESIGFIIIRKDRSIIGREIDIYIPNLKVGIEYDGLYWHSEECKENYYPDSKEDPKIKQLIKTELCTEKGIQLIHIFEDEWILYKSKIKELLQKILLEDYDLLDNDFSMITLNRRFSKNPKYYEKMGYEVKIIDPILYPNKEGFKVWDVGYLQLKQKRN